jgi:hypothetical protein
VFELMPQYQDFGFQPPPRLDTVAQHADESKAVAILQKPHTESDLIKAIIQTDVGVLCIRRGSLFPPYIAFAY